MSELSSEFKQFENELSLLNAESEKIKTKGDLKEILIRLTALQRIVYDEINQGKISNQDN